MAEAQPAGQGKKFSMTELEDAAEPLKLKDREPIQGEQFTEPKIGGLYPLAGMFLAGLALGVVAAAFALF